MGLFDYVGIYPVGRKRKILKIDKLEMIPKPTLAQLSIMLAKGEIKNLPVGFGDGKMTKNEREQREELLERADKCEKEWKATQPENDNKEFDR